MKSRVKFPGSTISPLRRASIFFLAIAALDLANPLGSGLNLLSITKCVLAMGCDEPSDGEVVQAFPTKNLELPFRFSLQCVCQDSKGVPIEGVEVRLFRAVNTNKEAKLEAEAISDSKGKVAFKNVATQSNFFSESLIRDVVVVASMQGSVSEVRLLTSDDDLENFKLTLATATGKLEGIIRAPDGKPVKGARVYFPKPIQNSIPGVLESLTDEEGNFQITDLPERKVQEGMMSFAYVEHPDFGTTQIPIVSLPSKVEVQMEVAQSITGKVIDDVSQKPVAGAVIQAQGMGDQGWFQTTSDDHGNYRLMVSADAYNVWAEMEDRVPVAIKALDAQLDVKNVDIHMVLGGKIVGRVVENGDGLPIDNKRLKNIHVGVSGPSRPRTGAAVLSVPVTPAGTFSIRVAPGKNYIYLMNGAASEFVEVKEGEELGLILQLGKNVPEAILNADPDLLLRRKWLTTAASRKLYRQAMQARATRQSDQTRLDMEELIAALKVQCEKKYGDVWLQSMKDIYDLGEEATPELIKSLDNTESDRMIRSLAFLMRAIGDKRAVPALIRAIPRTLMEPGSDMGLSSSQLDLLEFAQKHDLAEKDSPESYDVGRPVREVIGALEKLTNHRGQEDLYHTFLTGTPNQIRLKRELFHREAKHWSQWWNDNALQLVADDSYHDVKLEDLPSDLVPEAISETEPLSTNSQNSNWVLEAIYEEGARDVFFDIDMERSSPLPEKWRNLKDLDKHMDEILAWAEEAGYDMMGTEYLTETGADSSYAIRTIGVTAWELPKEYWKQTLVDVKLADLQQEGRKCGEILIHYDEEKKESVSRETGTFLIRTREGTPGILYLGIEVLDNKMEAGNRVGDADNELQPVAFQRGRRFGYSFLAPKGAKD